MLINKYENFCTPKLSLELAFTGPKKKKNSLFNLIIRVGSTHTLTEIRDIFIKNFDKETNVLKHIVWFFYSQKCT